MNVGCTARFTFWGFGAFGSETISAARLASGVWGLGFGFRV